MKGNAMAYKKIWTYELTLIIEKHCFKTKAKIVKKVILKNIVFL